MSCNRPDWGSGYAIVTTSRRRGAWLRDLWDTLTGSLNSRVSGPEAAPLAVAPDGTQIAYLERHPEPLNADSVDQPSFITSWLSVEGARLIVPLVTQGRLVGVLSLGERVSGGAYSDDDIDFLTTLADEAAAAVRIPQLMAQSRGQSPSGSLPCRACHGKTNHR